MKFNFSKVLMTTPPVEKETTPLVSLYKSGQLIVPANVNRKFGLDGAFIEIQFDAQKRTFGLKRMNGEPLPANEWTKTMRLLKANEKGAIRIPMGRVLKYLGLHPINYLGMEFGEYIDTIGDHKIYFFTLPKKQSGE